MLTCILSIFRSEDIQFHYGHLQYSKGEVMMREICCVITSNGAISGFVATYDYLHPLFTSLAPLFTYAYWCSFILCLSLCAPYCAQTRQHLRRTWEQDEMISIHRTN
ncbi:hypothetical protein BDZ91DRAFT_162429 [Kalaharituber pfeilii]|nr:hypothetical protein BDZ91DRAFT_162429 [Kalaharituber pfeilii]